MRSRHFLDGSLAGGGEIDPVEREVVYEFGQLDEVSPAYAITIHKSQGSEFPVIVTPGSHQHRTLNLEPLSMCERILSRTGAVRESNSGHRERTLIGADSGTAIPKRSAEPPARASKAT
ncbi:MAG: hypothetical protein EXS31_12975 [Pedosphaera sp.]|nr:hypothetical protein [Pedosphaera sp.]